MPVLKLTVKSVDRLIAPDPSTKQTVHWDTEIKGFGVVCSGATNSKTYVVQRTMPGGKNRRVTVGAVSEIGLDVARERAADALDALRRGLDPKAKSADPTLRQAFDDYLAARKNLRPETVRTYHVVVGNYLKPWLDLPMSKITSKMVEERHRAIAAEVATDDRKGECAANLSMRTFRALYNFLADRAAMPPNPTRRLRRQWYDEPRRETMVRADDISKFYRAVCDLDNDVSRDFILLLLFTGLRKTEAASLRWEDVDLTLRVIRVSASRTKSKQKLDLPMSSPVRDLLVRRRGIGGEFVFPGRAGHVVGARDAFAQIAAATGVDVSPHDLRRTFITMAESAEISAVAMKLLVNHSIGGDMTARYAVLSTERLREAAQKVADRIEELCAAQPADAPNLRQLRR
jgi:integrase